MNDLNTKLKILKVAHKLFSQKNFDGVSIREIANAAEVNIAAINYHYKNKEGLYYETIKASIEVISQDIRNIIESNEKLSLENLALSIYDYFIDNSEDLRTGFKLFLSTSEFYDHIEYEDEKIGPPGGGVLFNRIQKDFPNLEEADVIWAVRGIFTIIMHKAIVVCNKCSNRTEKEIIEEKAFIRSGIKRLVKLIIFELEAPKFSF